MNQEVRITKAAYSDLEAILDLQKLAFITEAELYGNFDIEPLKQTLDSIRKDYSDYIFLKAVIGTEIIGSVKVRREDSSCWVGKLFVHRSQRGKGIGRKLLAEVENIFPDVFRFYLFTGAKSISNIHLYESAGYRKYEEFTDEKNPGVVLIKMIKDTSPDK